MSFVQLGDLLKCAEYARTLYLYGWSRVYNATTAYLEFGADVSSLHTNLLQLQKVFDNVKSSATGHIPSGSSFYDVRDLDQILGEPFRTLEECRRLLHRRGAFAVEGNAITNIYWNTVVEAEVSALHKRIEWHNMRILALLKPLELKLLLDIQQLVTQYGEAILKRLEDIERRFFSMELQDPTTPVQTTATKCSQIVIPQYLIDLFENASRRAQPQTDLGPRFPINDGINAFLSHYKEDAAASTFSGGFLLPPPSQTPEQYVSMMKSIWIVQKIQASSEYITSCQRGNRLLKCFIEELAEKCLTAFNQFADKPNNPFQVRNAPDQNTVLQDLTDDAFTIWPKTELPTDRFETAATVDALKTVLRVPLKHQLPMHNLELLLLRQTETVLEMITKETRQDDEAGAGYARSRDIDLRLVCLNPIYADPARQSPEIDIGLHTMGSQGRDDLFTFHAYSHLYKFQEAITGYRTVLDVPDVDVVVQGDKRMEYRGRVQIWNYQKATTGQGVEIPQQQAPRHESMSSSPPTPILHQGGIPMSQARRPTPSPLSSEAGSPPPHNPFLSASPPPMSHLSASPPSHSTSISRRPVGLPDAQRRKSSTSAAQRKDSLFSTFSSSRSTQRANSLYPKTMDGQSLASFASTATHISDIKSTTADGHNLEAVVFEIPKPPVLVLFLRPRTAGPAYAGNDGLSILKLDISARDARLETGACPCPRDARSARSGAETCRHAGLSGPPKKPWGARPLRARLYSPPGSSPSPSHFGHTNGATGTGAGITNLAPLGLHHADRATAGTEQKLNFVALSFTSAQKRRDFEAGVVQVQEVERRRRDVGEMERAGVRFARGEGEKDGGGW
jgi:hypothetical protein